MPSPRAASNDSLLHSGDSPSPRVQWRVGPPISADQNGQNIAQSSTSDSSLSKKKKKHEIREKIINGFDSDSEDESDIGEETKPKSKTINEVAEGPDLDGELAALVEEQEVDELEDDDVDANEQPQQKRSMSIDDDISGELLELASGPPKKKKKTGNGTSFNSATSSTIAAIAVEVAGAPCSNNFASSFQTCTSSFCRPTVHTFGLTAFSIYSKCNHPFHSRFSYECFYHFGC